MVGWPALTHSPQAGHHRRIVELAWYSTREKAFSCVVLVFVSLWVLPFWVCVLGCVLALIRVCPREETLNSPSHSLFYSSLLSRRRSLHI